MDKLLDWKNHTLVIAVVLINKPKDRVLGSLAHVAAGLANNLLKGLHHCILHTYIGGLRTSNKL